MFWKCGENKSTLTKNPIIIEAISLDEAAKIYLETYKRNAIYFQPSGHHSATAASEYYGIEEI